MSMDPGWLFVSMLISGVGMGFFIYGKKQSRYPQLFAGLLLIGYTYFVENLALMVALAVMILLALWWAIRRGY